MNMFMSMCMLCTYVCVYVCFVYIDVRLYSLEASCMASSFPGGLVGKESTYNPRDSGMGRSLGEGNGNPL